MTWESWAAEECHRIRVAGLWRSPRDLDALGPAGKLAPSGRRVVSFASNDYLGLTAHPEVIAAAHRALDRWGSGSGSARLIVGSRPIHTELEQQIAIWKRTQRAALFPTGFQANLGVLTTFGEQGVLICSDELNHASIVDGCRLSKAEVAVYPHCDMSELDRLLATADRAVVVTDAVFSMDGDVASLTDLVQVCARRGALLVLDEAHAVLGPEPDLDSAEILRVGTLSKFLGSLGGYVAGPAALVDLIVNRARPYIFTTATTPADAAAAFAALLILRSPEGAALKQRLRAVIDRFASGHPSPIFPIVLGEPETALEASEKLLERGFLVTAIRPPSVPAGTARLRVTLSAAHTDEQVDALTEALAEIAPVVVGTRA